MDKDKQIIIEEFIKFLYKIEDPRTLEYVSQEIKNLIDFLDI